MIDLRYSTNKITKEEAHHLSELILDTFEDSGYEDLNNICHILFKTKTDKYKFSFIPNETVIRSNYNSLNAKRLKKTPNSFQIIPVGNSLKITQQTKYKHYFCYILLEEIISLQIMINKDEGVDEDNEVN